MIQRLIHYKQSLQRLSLILCLILVASQSYSQTLADKYDKLRPLIKTDRLLIAMHYDIWQNTPSNVKRNMMNRGIALSLIHDMPLGTSNVSIGVGIRLDINNFYSNGIPTGMVDSAANSSSPLFTSLDTLAKGANYDYANNRLVANYLSIPIEIRFRAGENDRYKFTLGADIGYNIRSHIKYVGDDLFFNSNRSLKLKMYGVEGLNPLRYGVYSRFGYGNYTAEIYYSLSGLFQDSKEQMYPLQIGVCLTLF